MTHRLSVRRPMIAAAAVVALGLLTPFARAQDDEYRGPGAVPSPGTYEGSRQIQEQQQQQDQQFREQQQQQPSYDQPEPDPNRRVFGSTDPYPAVESGPWGAIYVDPLHPTVARSSFNFPSAATARAAANGACYQVAHARCKEALVFSNACGARAINRSGVWAARAAGSAAEASAEAVQACEKTTGQPCKPLTPMCSPNND